MGFHRPSPEGRTLYCLHYKKIHSTVSAYPTLPCLHIRLYSRVFAKKKPKKVILDQITLIDDDRDMTAQTSCLTAQTSCLHFTTRVFGHSAITHFWAARQFSR